MSFKIAWLILVSYFREGRVLRNLGLCALGTFLGLAIGNLIILVVENATTFTVVWSILGTLACATYFSIRDARS